MKNDKWKTENNPVSRLRRDLGTLESYAALIGILIGAGIFQVTSRAWAITGPSVILGYILLTPAILATSIPYAAYLSSPLGREPGGEYLHISRTVKGYRLAYVGAWLKIISYIGAGAYLADAMAGYLIALSGGRIDAQRFQLPISLAALVVFYLIHVIGIRWFGRMQVALSALKCLALLVLIVPGLFVLDSSNYTPFFTHGVNGFAASLLPLFFAYAGFESLAQTAGEVKDSTRRLPKIMLNGIIITALRLRLHVDRVVRRPARRTIESEQRADGGGRVDLSSGGRGGVCHDRRDSRDHDRTERNDARSIAAGDHDRRRSSRAALAWSGQSHDRHSHSRTDLDAPLLRAVVDQRTTIPGAERCSFCARRALFHS
jgi:hypothetical protein